MQKDKINKNIAWISFLLVLVFIISLMMCFVQFTDKYTIDNLRYQNSINSIDKQNAIYKSSASNSGGSIVKEDPIFTDSKTAITTGLKALEIYDKYQMTSTGKVFTDVGIVQKTVLSEIEAYLYSKSERFIIQEIYEVPATINIGMTQAKKNYTYGATGYEQTTGSVSLSGNNTLSSYFGSNSYTQTKPSVFKAIDYKINNSTILSTKDLVVYYNNDGTVNHYSVDFELNPKTGVSEYAKNVKANAGADELPVFTKVSMRMEIDRDGNISVLSINESYNIKMMGFSADCTSKFIYTFSSFGVEPSMPRPKV